MSTDVDPESLRAAAGVLADLPEVIKSAPPLGNDSVKPSLAGLSITAALDSVATASAQARLTVSARYDEFAAQLAKSADEYENSDVDVANNLAAIPNLNSFDGVEGPR